MINMFAGLGICLGIILFTFSILGIINFIQEWKGIYPYNKMSDKPDRTVKSMFNIREGLLELREKIEVESSAYGNHPESEDFEYKLPKIVNGNFECGLCKDGVIEKTIIFEIFMSKLFWKPSSLLDRIIKKIKTKLCVKC